MDHHDAFMTFKSSLTLDMHTIYSVRKMNDACSYKHFLSDGTEHIFEIK